MPSSSEVYSHGKVRFFRLAAILHEEGRELLKLFFKTFHTGKTLDAYLNEPRNKNIIDRAYTKQVIYPEQYVLLYPPGTIAKADARFFDITLLVFLIRSLHPRLNINDIVWKTPSPLNKSVEACITRLKDTRNKLWGHIHELDISEADYSAHCAILQDLFETMAYGIGDLSYLDTDVADKIRKRQIARMDPDSENRQLILLQSWKRYGDHQELYIIKLDEIYSDIKQIKEVICQKPETRTVGTSTAEDTPDEVVKRNSKSLSLSSLSSGGTIYEQPVVSRHTREIFSDDIELINVEDDLKGKTNDKSTSTSSLVARTSRVYRLFAFLMPFIGPPPSHRPSHPSSQEPLVAKSSSTRQSNRRRQNPFSRLSCIRDSRRFRRTPSKIITERHDHLPNRCFISGMVHLLSGLLVMVDNTHRCMQVFDQWCAPIDTYKCDYPIKSICAYRGDKTFAVTLYQNKCVALFEVTRKGGIRYLETVCVHCGGWLTDVKYIDGKLYTLCDQSDIHIHHFRSIPDDVIQFRIGETLNSFDISSSSGRVYLYVAYSDGVICFTEAGKEMWEFKQNENGAKLEIAHIKRHRNKLFVSSWGTNRVIELTTDGGERLRDIGVGKVFSPWAVDVSLTGEQLFVSQYSASLPSLRCSEILVF